MKAPVNLVLALRADESERGKKAVQTAVDRLQRVGATLLGQAETAAVLGQIDARDLKLLWRARELVVDESIGGLRFGLVSGVKEVGPAGALRLSQRSLTQARALVGSAVRGDLLLSSQLGSLLIVSQPEVEPLLRPSRVLDEGGRAMGAYRVDLDAEI